MTCRLADHPAAHADRGPARDALQVDDVEAVKDGELDVLVSGLVQVLHVRHGDLAFAAAATLAATC
ncbi:hypothetical protein [Nonomuraea basaltis]|uniref:hypothetical protein n=1 Tax=Nonomuraea basaltis TaxID=2495887 RepID=UPI0014864FEE|nr:hypothetical protein [Nonomuraea basaltis]